MQTSLCFQARPGSCHDLRLRALTTILIILKGLQMYVLREVCECLIYAKEATASRSYPMLFLLDYTTAWQRGSMLAKANQRTHRCMHVDSNSRCTCVHAGRAWNSTEEINRNPSSPPIEGYPKPGQKGRHAGLLSPAKCSVCCPALLCSHHCISCKALQQNSPILARSFANNFKPCNFLHNTIRTEIIT